MDHDQAMRDLKRALHAMGAETAAPGHLHAARQLLLDRGRAALAIDPAINPPLARIIEIAVTARPNPDRRSFAVMLVHALGVDGVVRTRSTRANLDRAICSFVESALQNPLHRSGYPLSAETSDKIRFLIGLGGSIDQHLTPLEPTFPTWLSGLQTDEKL